MVVTGTLLKIRKHYPKVNTIINAKRNVKFTVGVHECRTAEPGSPFECAAAKALQKRFDGAIITKSVAYLITSTKAIRYRVPESLAREVVSFDRKAGFSPGTYHLAKAKSLGPSGKHNPNTKRKRSTKYVHITNRVRVW